MSRQHYLTYSYTLSANVANRQITARRQGTGDVELTVAELLPLGLTGQVKTLTSFLSRERVEALRDMCNEILEDWHGGT